MLNSGTNDSEFNRIVKSYVMAWWKGTRKPADGGILATKNLEQCLKKHRHLLLKTMDGKPIPEHLIIPIPSLQLLVGPKPMEPIIETDICTQCTVYKSLAVRGCYLLEYS